MGTQNILTTERLDDVVLLLHVMMQMGLPELLNRHLPRHWKQEGLDWGWVMVIWLGYILSEGDHRKVVVREWVKQRENCNRASVWIAVARDRFYGRPFGNRAAKVK